MEICPLAVSDLIRTYLNYLARSAIYFACINFFLFLNDRSEKNYLRIRWTDFHDLCTKR